MKIVVTGATGLIGKKICKKLLENGGEVIVFSRSPEKAKSLITNANKYVKWDYEDETNTGWKNELNNADSIVHLAGENVMSHRWNEAHKSNVLNSRVLGTRSLVEAISKNSTNVKSFISASAVGFYGNSEITEFTEDSAAGNNFLADVTKQWEREVQGASDNGIREVRIRIGIVLDKNEGALAKMITPFNFFIGGPLGDGKQWFPWVHVDDVTGIFLHALNNENVSGALNAVSPGIVNMKQFCKELGNVMKRPSSLNVPGFALKIVLGEGADVVTQGAKVVPKKTTETGYSFKFDKLERALSDLVA